MAFRCFFGLLFGGSLPAGAAGFLPESVHAALPEGDSARARSGSSRDSTKKDTRGDRKGDAQSDPAGDAKSDPTGDAKSDPTGDAKGGPKGDSDVSPGSKDADRDSERAGKAQRSAPSASAVERHRDGALALLALLQREGRLVDFLCEPIDDYDDSDIGAAVRDIHRGCKKVLDDHLALEPVMPGDEDDDVKVPKGFDPGEVRLIGEVSGEPPFKGVLRHHGWRVTRASLPSLSEGVDRHVLAPAEVEVS